MSKYEPLGQFLRSRTTSEVPMSFGDIERVIGAALPPKAQHHRAWWSNNPNNNVATKVWLDAGFCTERVDLGSRRLVFRRMAPSSRPPGASPPSATPSPSGDDAPRRSPLFGRLKGLVRIAPGTDLTAPTATEWSGLE